MTHPSTPDEIVARALDFVLEAFNTIGEYKAADYLEGHVQSLRTPKPTPTSAPPSGLEQAGRPLFDQMRELVAAWHSQPGYERHPAELGVTLETNCGVVYAIVDALSSLDRNGGGT